MTVNLRTDGDAVRRKARSVLGADRVCPALDNSSFLNNQSVFLRVLSREADDTDRARFR
jgi:hypothetical protein